MKKGNLFQRRFAGLLMMLAFFTTAMMSYSLSPPEPGDVNGDGKINIIDALSVARYAAGFDVPGFWTALANVNGDSSIDIVDALMLARYSAGLITCFLPGCDDTPIADNPFDAAQWYVNPEWSQMAASGGGEAISGYNTAIWLSNTGSITDGIGVTGHLDNALQNGDDLIVFVINNMPNKACGSSSYTYDQTSFNSYVFEFIDPLAAIFSNPAYEKLRIICIIEPNTLAHLVTNLDIPACSEANGPGGYNDSIVYALNSFSEIPNVYNYLDISFSGHLGWASNMPPAVSLYTACVQGTNKGFDSIHGFASNVANYVPVKEIFLPDSSLTLAGSGIPIRSANFYEWNDYFDEESYTKALYDAFVAEGFPSSIGMIIDTSRNGWGGSDRPTAASTSTDINTYVDQSRLDRRAHRSNYCNQTAGLGERPKANPGPNHIDAYLWIKEPGISDGISTPDFEPDPNDPTLQFDPMCDGNPYQTYQYPNYPTGALPDAPHKGYWHQAQFELLLQNAYPPVE